MVNGKMYVIIAALVAAALALVACAQEMTDAEIEDRARDNGHDDA